MSSASDAVARAGRVVFELDRFAVAGEDRLVVEGAWFGVRGRRFIRPSLTVMVEGNETRLLADLADKPWAAEDGEPWRAAFPAELDIKDLEMVELAVAPDITITLLGSPEASGGGKTKPPKNRTESSGPRRARGAHESQDRQFARRLERAKAEKAQTEARLDELLGQLGQVARERDEASVERDRLVAERDQLIAERETVERERDDIAAQLDAARTAREEAIGVTKAARLAHDRAVEDRDVTTASHRRAEAERDAAIADRDRAIAERDGALALRDHAVAERDAASAARDDAAHQRDALARTSERLQSELADLSSSR